MTKMPSIYIQSLLSPSLRLPMRIDSKGKTPNAFTKLFGNKSLKIARRLLTESLKKEQGSEIKAEIERRMNLLEPNPVTHIKCRVCKKILSNSKRKGKQAKNLPRMHITIQQKKIDRNLKLVNWNYR
jgi:hypothetical protein